jgi:predicted CXXCH cytochrome family protein
LLLQEPAALCLGCHAPVKEDVDAEVKHPPVHEGRRCLACHDPHAGQAPGLLLAPAYDLCMRCHSSDAGGGKPEPGKSEPGKSEPPSAEAQRGAPRLIDLGRLLRENPVQHAPVAARKCVACHQPHGSSNFRLLVQPYPPKFYAPYDPANYKLCWECHKQALAEEEETTTATQFRDGSRNLHFLHVNKEKGRTCRACHEVHASKQPHQIRDTVPFGAEGWTLELHYTATPTGGICQKTCHGLRSYDHGPLPPAAGR